MLDGERVWGSDWCLVQRVRGQPVSAGRLPSRHQWGSATPAAVVAGLADVGVLLWLMSEICLGGIFTSGTAIEVSTTVYLSAGAVTLALAGGLRSKVRTLSVVEVDRRPERSAAMYAEWETLVGLLTDADALRQQGRFRQSITTPCGGGSTTGWDLAVLTPSTNNRRSDGIYCG